MTKQVLKYLCDDCKLDFTKCICQSYENAVNMCGRYNDMQKEIWDANQFAMYVPCADYSLNLVGRSDVDCSQVAGNSFSTLTAQWKILTDCIGNENFLNHFQIPHGKHMMWLRQRLSTLSSKLRKLWKIYQMIS